MLWAEWGKSLREDYDDYDDDDKMMPIMCVCTYHSLEGVKKEKNKTLKYEYPSTLFSIVYSSIMSTKYRQSKVKSIIIIIISINYDQAGRRERERERETDRQSERKSH